MTVTSKQVSSALHVDIQWKHTVRFRMEFWAIRNLLRHRCRLINYHPAAFPAEHFKHVHKAVQMIWLFKKKNPISTNSHLLRPVRSFYRLQYLQTRIWQLAPDIFSNLATCDMRHPVDITSGLWLADNLLSHIGVGSAAVWVDTVSAVKVKSLEREGRDPQ